MDTGFLYTPFVFTSPTSPNFYAEGLNLQSPDDQLTFSHGQVFGLLTISLKDTSQIRRSAHEIWPAFCESYYSSSAEHIFEHLKKVFEESCLRFDEEIKKLELEDVRYAFSVGVLHGKVLYVVRKGPLGMRIYRGTSFGVLFEHNDIREDIVSASGFLEVGDVALFYGGKIDVTQFPIQLRDLGDLAPAVLYTKLEQFFGGEASEEGGVCGVYVQAEEQLVVGGNDLSAPKIVYDTQHQEIHDVYMEEKEEDVVVTHADAPIPVVSKFPSTAALQSHLPKIRGIVPVAMLYKGARFFTHQRLFILGCMLLVAFLGLALAGRDFKSQFKKQENIVALKAEKLPKIQELYEQGQYYADLNPERAKEYLKQAKDQLAAFGEQGAQDTEINALLEKVHQSYASVTKMYELGALQAYFDLSTLTVEARGNTMGFAGSEIVVGDAAKQVVYVVGTENKAARAIMGPRELEQLYSVAGDETKQQYYAVGGRGILKVVKDESSAIQMEPLDSDWGEIADMEVYSGNVYLLDKGKSQIWKYTPKDEESFSAVKGYIPEEESISLRDAKSFVIDGNVWIATAKGEVLKLVSGVRESFVLRGLEQPLTSLDALATVENSDYLYLLDGSEGRIVVVDKQEGGYVATYLSEKLKGSKDVVMDGTKNALYVVNDQYVYTFNLKETLQSEQP